MPESAQPTDAVTTIEASCAQTAAPAIAARMRSPSARSASASLMPSSRTRNSSPPTRATASCSRIVARMRRATSTSTTSPAAWPRPSLMRLKRSMSSSSTPSAWSPAQPAIEQLGQHAAVGHAGERVDAPEPVGLGARGLERGVGRQRLLHGVHDGDVEHRAVEEGAAALAADAPAVAHPAGDPVGADDPVLPVERPVATAWSWIAANTSRSSGWT